MSQNRRSEGPYVHTANGVPMLPSPGLHNLPMVEEQAKRPPPPSHVEAQQVSFPLSSLLRVGAEFVHFLFA